MLSQINTLCCEQKNWKTKQDKDCTLIHAMQLLQLAKGHVLGLSDVKQ